MVGGGLLLLTLIVLAVAGGPDAEWADPAGAGGAELGGGATGTRGGRPGSGRGVEARRSAAAERREAMGAGGRTERGGHRPTGGPAVARRGGEHDHLDESTRFAEPRRSSAGR
ncbi:hypothetical protein ACE1SV_59260 [Streptomyces sennicomposti]